MSRDPVPYRSIKRFIFILAGIVAFIALFVYVDVTIPLQQKSGVVMLHIPEFSYKDVCIGSSKNSQGQITPTILYPDAHFHILTGQYAEYHQLAQAITAHPDLSGKPVNGLCPYEVNLSLYL